MERGLVPLPLLELYNLASSPVGRRRLWELELGNLSLGLGIESVLHIRCQRIHLRQLSCHPFGILGLANLVALVLSIKLVSLPNSPLQKLFETGQVAAPILLSGLGFKLQPSALGISGTGWWPSG